MALGNGGQAQDLISFDFEDELIEIVDGDFHDSVLENETISSRFYSEDSDLYEVKFARMRSNLKMIQVLWVGMLGLALVLGLLQFFVWWAEVSGRGSA